MTRLCGLALKLYVAQAVLGFAIGFAYPWLKLFGAIQ